MAILHQKHYFTFEHFLLAKDWWLTKPTFIDLSDDEDEVEAKWMVDVSGKHEDDLMGDKDMEYDHTITYQSL
ncbi:hypothetical protein CROQUDRAFT_87644 [Cronartium quercuum f. sp. fusiforme G11]|uniref:Uncharacterized protein n=1 Tax=Cronartium quercuum f. sp. fusiforme G11 TaxID=708437 RepID=A0A9P6TGJ9_9BASI|nr:hypothetical protein CROQUDRAFT_87644 [Cronartium quercuum f. sp. fusiforme G11]